MPSPNYHKSAEKPAITKLLVELRKTSTRYDYRHRKYLVYATAASSVVSQRAYVWKKLMDDEAAVMRSLKVKLRVLGHTFHDEQMEGK